MTDYLEGIAGQAWKLDLNLPSDSPISWSATLTYWLLLCPGQSPAWSHYLISVISLRDIPGVPPAKKRFESATHELMIVALNPKLGKDLSPENYIKRVQELEEPAWLFPLNLIYHFTGSDEEAISLCYFLVQGVVGGVLPAEPPLSGGDYWTSSLDKTLEHIRFGGHHNITPLPGSFGTGKT